MSPEKFVDLSGIKTRYFEAGSGEAMLLVHGGNAGDSDNVDCANNWDLNWEGFSKNFNVFAIDRLGQGYTDNPQVGEYVVENIIGHLRNFVDRLHGRVHLVGHSRGGYMCLRLARELPERIASITIVDSSTAAAGDNVFRGPLLADAPRPLLTRESIAWVTSRFSYSDAHLTESWMDARAAIAATEKNKWAVQNFPRTLEPSLNAQKAETLGWIAAGHMKTPTMLVWGKNDPSAILPRGLELFELISQSVPKSSMHIFNRAGHYSYREHPHAFVATVTAFIKTQT